MVENRLMIQSSIGKLDSVINYPENKTDRLAVLCPGYLDSKDYSGLADLANRLAGEGYTVVRFDPTGIWGSEGDISRYTTTQYLRDIRSVIDYMLKEGNFKHILVGGHSRGGQMALLYAARDQRISAVLGIMPSSNLSKKEERGDQRINDWKNTGFSISTRDLPDNREIKRTFKVPITHLDDLRKYDVLKEVKKIRVLIVLIAGELDVSCPPDTIKEIFVYANEPKKFLVIPKIGHNYRLNEKEVELVDKEILKLLKESV